MYFIKRFTSRRNIWKEHRNFNNKEEASTPTKLNENWKEINSSKKIVQILSNFFKNMIEDMRKEFKKVDDDPITLLSKLIEKPET